MKIHPFLAVILISSICATACSLGKNKGGVQSAANVQTSQTQSGTAQTQATTQEGVQTTDMSAGHTVEHSVHNGTLTWNVDDVGTVDVQMQQAKSSLESAETAIKNQGFSQAIQYARESYLHLPTTDAIRVAAYAASRLSPIELTRLYGAAETHFERAVVGQMRVNFCAAQNDQACLDKVLPETIESLYLIGENDNADRLSKYGMQNGVAQTPVAAVMLPLSGKDRKIGRAMLGSMLQAAGIYNHKRMPMHLRFFDTRSSAAAIPEILAEIDKAGIRLIVGPVDIQECNAVAHGLGEKVMIGFSPNDSFVGDLNGVYQFSYAIAEEAQQIAQMLIGMNAQTIVSISTDDAYAATTVEQLKASLPQGVNVSAFTYPAKQTDLRDLAKKAAAAAPDTVFLPVSVDVAERIMSFMAQENIWCAKPGTPQPKAASDQRRFVTCMATSAWAPIKDDQRFKFINEAIYLDYSDAANKLDTDFASGFEGLYHRPPAVHEVLPFTAITMMRSLKASDFESKTSLTQAVGQIFGATRYLMLPGARRITSAGTAPYVVDSAQTPVTRTLINQ